MAHSEADIQRRAARAYELGRTAAALRQVAPVALFLVGVPLLTGSGSAVLGAALALAGAATLWRGGVIGRAARAGLLAGLAPLLTPALVGGLGHHCAGCGPAVPMPLCIAMCVGAGAIAGALLALMAARERRRLTFAAVALAFAATAGALGCVFAGAGGLLGLAAGLTLGSVPPLVAAAARLR
jgi:hypothetical protein